MDKHSYSDWLSLALNRSRNALWEEGFPWKDIAAFIFLNVHVNNQTHHSAYLHRSHYVSGIHIDYMFTLYTRLKQYTSEYTNVVSVGLYQQGNPCIQSIFANTSHEHCFVSVHWCICNWTGSYIYENFLIINSF